MRTWQEFHHVGTGISRFTDETMLFPIPDWALAASITVERDDFDLRDLRWDIEASHDELRYLFVIQYVTDTGRLGNRDGACANREA